jgi:glycosyltransferase involved in cell wall biosynthesis
MKILMISRNTLYTSPGGDTVQLEMTANHLRTLGVDVDIYAGSESVNYEDYDLLHFFNITRPDNIICHMKKQVPYVVSTVFVDYSEYDRKVRGGISGMLFKMLSSSQIEYAKAIARFLVGRDTISSRYFVLHGQFRSVMHVAENAMLLLPNSHSEYRRFENAFGRKFSYRKVVNAINRDVFNGSVIPDENYKDHILAVGRIEGLKNQLNVIKAVIGTRYRLTIIGRPTLNQKSYYEACRKLAAGHANINFVERQLAHKELVSIYKAARVHVLASWFETTGLVSLEAAMMDCNIVATRKGDTEEYFGDMAYYCDPGDVASIRNAIDQAYNSPVSDKLKSHISANYTWDHAAQQTYEAYEIALKAFRTETGINKSLYRRFQATFFNGGN